MPHLDLSADVVTLTQQLVDIESVSHDEQEIADAVETALLALPHLTVTRRGHTVVARTDLGRGERVVIAGHLDTVPLNDNLPSRLEDGVLHGLGSCDMKGGDAVMLKLAADVTSPNRDLTFIFYEAEEVDSVHNGLRKLTESDPDLLQAAEDLVRRAGWLPDAPVTVPLRQLAVLALTGPPSRTRPLARSLVCELAAFHAPDDLQLLAASPPSAGPDWANNAETQIRWGLGYIRDRYGSACGAWGFKSGHGWY